MINGFYNGISGVKTHGFGIDVIANNISNINTNGYKSSNAEFKSLLYQSPMGVNPVSSQIGMGSTPMGTALDFAQGSLLKSDNIFDLAISGNGFFGVSGVGLGTTYTRNGDFTLDGNGNLVDRDGRFLLGTMGNLTQIELSQNAKEIYGNSAVNGVANPNLNAFTLPTDTSIKLTDTKAQQNIKLPDVLFLPSKPTTKISYKGNLDSKINTESQTITLDSKKFTQTVDKENKTMNLEGSLADQELQKFKANQEIIITIKDKNGNKVKTKVNADEEGKFKIENLDVKNLNLDDELEIIAKTDTKVEIPNTTSFETEVISPNGGKNILKFIFEKQVPAGVNGTNWNATATLYSPTKEVLSTSTGVLNFNDKGALIGNTLTSIDNEGSNLQIDLGTIYDPDVPNSGFDGMRSAADQALNLAVDKDGEPEGLLKSYTMNDNGEIVAVFDNGKMASVAKIALYHFQNPQGLEKVGANSFASSSNSGEPIFYTDQNGDVIYGASIRYNTLEASNTNLGSSLTDLIMMQKAYDANAKSISTTDQMLQQAINMKK